LAAELAHRSQIELALRARIHELREAEAQERERGMRSQHLAQELQDTLRINELFTGVLAHDLRAPLAAIMTAAQLMKLRDTDTDGPNAKAIRRVLASGDRMSRMIEQLLDFTRARLGEGIPVDLTRGDLRDISHAVVEELEAQHPRRIRFEAESVPGSYDPDRLAQVVSNLVTNALQHGAADELVDVRVSSRNGSGRLEVVNRGTPIPEDVRAHIFEPFRRAEGTQASGLGLGLFIAREIVRAHGGTIDVDSKERLTTFAIELPTRATLPG
jgi:signal transduction histidine kinase